MNFDVPKKSIMLKMPFFGDISMKLKKRICKIIEYEISCVKLNVVFNSGTTIGDMFPFKDRMPFLMNSHVVGQWQFGDAWMSKGPGC